MTHFTAITRPVSRSIINCELTHLERLPIDLEKARRQHLAYQAALRSLGVECAPVTRGAGSAGCCIR